MIKNTLIGSIVAMSLLFSSCGQVRFSGQNTSTDPEPPATPVDPGNPDIPVSTIFRDVNYKGSVDPTVNKVDILLVIDDSNSMLADNQRLAARLAGFVTALKNSSIDWQMCVTLTRQLNVGGTLYWGASVNWTNYTPPTGTPAYILKSSATNLNQIFNSTIDAIGAGWAGTDDERGIKAAYEHAVKSQFNNCYRSDAAFSAIIISDEDVRSVGGDPAAVFYKGELKTLEPTDLAETYIEKIKSLFGASKRFTVNSIIVKNGDTACKAAQDAAGSKSHYGKQYQKLSTLSGGAVGSICDNDYSANLNYFKDAIQNSLGSLPLECAPVNGNFTVNITPTLSNVVTSLQGQNLVFAPVIPQGHTLEVNYKCPVINSKNRLPSSEGGVMGFWAKLYSWIVEPVLSWFR